MRQFLRYAIPAFLLFGILSACQKEYEPIEVIDERSVTAYIQQNNLNVQEYENSGAYYQVVSPGTGSSLEYSHQVPLVLSTRTLDGKYVATDTFAVDNRYYDYLGYLSPEMLRVGIKEILKNRNGAIRMIIPSRLAFGRNGTANIPGNASLDILVRVLDTAKLAEYDDYSITKYLERNNLTGFSKTSSGVYYKIAEAGTGSPITVDSTIVTEYTGKLLNGKIFEATTAGKGLSFSLSQVIKGWQETIPLIKQGGTIRVVIPSALAYGLSGNDVIPPFSSLDYSVKVTDVKK